jgi:Rieske Fe-S protein
MSQLLQTAKSSRVRMSCLLHWTAPPLGRTVRTQGWVANFAEYVTGGDGSSVGELEPGQGAVVRQGTQKMAAYRDDSGHLHVRSAVCTHANCILHWNAFERCWDCPCHGSQFSVDGEPINGPAIYRLAKPEPAP